jgi:putative transposase
MPEGAWIKRYSSYRKIIYDWQQDYNECRPHWSLNYQTVSEFNVGWSNGKIEGKHAEITD